MKGLKIMATTKTDFDVVLEYLELESLSAFVDSQDDENFVVILKCRFPISMESEIKSKLVNAKSVYFQKIGTYYKKKTDFIDSMEDML